MGKLDKRIEQILDSENIQQKEQMAHIIEMYNLSNKYSIQEYSATQYDFHH